MTYTASPRPIAKKVFYKILHLVLLCVFLANKPVIANDVLNINLDQWESSSLLKNSYYLSDPKGKFTFETLPNREQWEIFSRDQFRLGQIQGNIWLDIRFHTSGTQTLEAVLEFHRLIDIIDTRVIIDGKLSNTHHMSSYLNNPLKSISSNKNVALLNLQPNQSYQLLLRISGNNVVTGTVELWEKQAFQVKDQIVLYFFIAYAVAVSAIALYNLGAYYSTQFKAFLFHAFYGFSIVLFQSSHYGYLDSFLQTDIIRRKEILIVFSLACTFSSVVAFVRALMETKHTNPLIDKLSLAIIAFALIIALSASLINYQIAILALTFSILFGLLLGTVLLVKLKQEKDTRFFLLLFILSIFTPSSTLLILSRFGLIDQTFLTDHLILLIIVAEKILASALLFSQIRKMRLIFWRSQFIDPSNHLPNIIALKAYLADIKHHKAHYALSYIWISGLERMEIARGEGFRNQYLQDFSSQLTQQCKDQYLLVDIKDSTHLFYCDKNTFGIITNPLRKEEIIRLQDIVRNVLAQLKKSYGYNLDLVPIIASCNDLSAQASIESTIQNTNVALSQCIKNKHNLLLYNDEVGYNERKHINLISDFEKSVAEQQFILHWQPQIDTKTQDLAGLEALVRWHHPTYGFISPAEFIPLLEQNLKITSLSLWVIKQVFIQAPLFLTRHPHLDISINLSVYDLLNSELLPAIDNITQYIPQSIIKHIIMEVTESVLMEDTPTVLHTVNALQQRGFRISIDDFGAGYASFSYLQTLPANELKIDRRYTETCHEPNSQAIIQSIIYLAKQLNMQIVVEGIEDKAQQDMFSHWGVHRLQGWKLGKPVTQQELLAKFPSSIPPAPSPKVKTHNPAYLP